MSNNIEGGCCEAAGELPPAILIERSDKKDA
jgi:hypothetical protein